MRRLSDQCARASLVIPEVSKPAAYNPAFMTDRTATTTYRQRVAAGRLSFVARPSSRERREMVRAAHMLPLLPPAAVSRRAAAGARRGAEFGSGLARIGRLEDLAFGARS